MTHELTQEKRYILTGAPGSGKTSVIQKLEESGYNVIHEAATDVITHDQSLGIPHPWELGDFTDKIVCLQRYRQKHASGMLQFYDRSPFCTYALAQYLSQTKNIACVPSEPVLEEIGRCIKSGIYQDKVFFFENLGFIERTDARKISYEDALVFERIHLDVYDQFGFEIFVVPRGLTVQQRCDFILTSVEPSGSCKSDPS